MKTTMKKVARNFRINPEINAELRKRSDLTGIPETRIIEDSLSAYFNGLMSQNLKREASNFRPLSAQRRWGAEWVSPVLSPVV
jgi:hypothetical protein